MKVQLEDKFEGKGLEYSKEEWDGVLGEYGVRPNIHLSL